MLRNILTLLTGTLFAQAVTILASPILSRLYNPDDFGVSALYAALVGAGTIVATGSLELGILLPRQERTAYHVAMASVICSFAFGIISFIIVCLLHDEICLWLNNPYFDVWLYLVPFGIVISAVSGVIQYWINRHKEYKLMTSVRMAQSMITVGLNLILGMRKFITGGLVIGAFVGSLAGVMLLWSHVRQNVHDFVLNRSKLLGVISRYKDFPRYNMFSQLLNNLSASLPVFMLGIFFSPEVVGLFAMANRCVSLPMSVIGGSTAQVYVQQSAELRWQPEKLRYLTELVFSKLLMLSMLPFTVLFGFGDYIFAFLFGDNWRIAGEYAQILCPWLVFVFIGSPISSLLLVLDRQKESLIFNVSIFILRLLAFVVGGYYMADAEVTLMLYSGVGFCMWVGLQGYIQRLAGIPLGKSVREIVLYIVVPFGAVWLLRILCFRL